MKHVFILGAGRSGTKILRDCLGSAENISTIPYDVGYVWKYGNQLITHDELLIEHLRPEISNYVRKTIRKMSVRSAAGKSFDTVLEKSVPNTLRPAFMKEIFPNAKFIHLIRDGRDVVESSMRNWQSPSDTGYFWDKLRYFPIQNAPYALYYAANRLKKFNKSVDVQTWGPKYNGIQHDANSLPLVDVCAQQWHRCVSACHQQFADFADTNVMEVRYEDFIANQDTVKLLCDFMEIDNINNVTDFHKKYVKKNQSNGANTTMTPYQQERVMDIAGEMLSIYGYI